MPNKLADTKAEIKTQMLKDEKYYIEKTKKAIQETIKILYQYGLEKQKLILKPSEKKKKSKDSDCFRRLITGLSALNIIKGFLATNEETQNIKGRICFLEIINLFCKIKINDIQLSAFGNNPFYDQILLILSLEKKLSLESDIIFILVSLSSLITFLMENYDNDQELKKIYEDLKETKFEQEPQVLCQKIHTILAEASSFQTREKPAVASYSKTALIEEIKTTQEKVKNKPSFLSTLFFYSKHNNVLQKKIKKQLYFLCELLPHTNVFFSLYKQVKKQRYHSYNLCPSKSTSTTDEPKELYTANLDPF